jgi:hypothetical protein
MGEKWPRILPKVTTSTSLLGSFTCPKARYGTGGFTSTPKEGVLRIFFALKIRRLRPGLNPLTWVPKASTLHLDHPSRYFDNYYDIYFLLMNTESVRKSVWFYSNLT